MPRDGIEIERAETSVRRKRAIAGPTPIHGTPASAPIAGTQSLSGDGGQRENDTHASVAPVAPIEPAETSVRKRRAMRGTTPITRSPGVSPIGLDDNPDRELRAMARSTPIHQSPSVPPIGPAKRRGRPRKAKVEATPRPTPPSVALIDQDESSDREQRAMAAATPNLSSPAAPPIGHDGNAVVGGDGHQPPDTHSGVAISATVVELVQLQKLRRFAITEKNRSERAIESLIASLMGFRIDASEKERKAMFARAKAFRLAVEGGKGDIDDKLSPVIPTVLASASARAPWVLLLKKTEMDMEQQVKNLPVYDFAKSVKGFGAVGLAVLTAEAGIPIGDYRTVSGLWKRMGLAVIGDKDQYVASDDKWHRIGEPALNDKRQQRCTDKTEANIHGYSPKRRAEVWAFVSDSMFKHQWHGERDEDGNRPDKSGKPAVVPAGPSGPYGEVYGRRIAHTEPRIAATEHLPTGHREKWTRMRCNNDARRVMSKALLRDLWRVWRGLPPRGSAPND